jgi:hypothetical protein
LPFFPGFSVLQYSLIIFNSPYFILNPTSQPAMFFYLTVACETRHLPPYHRKRTHIHSVAKAQPEVSSAPQNPKCTRIASTQLQTGLSQKQGILHPFLHAKISPPRFRRSFLPKHFFGVSNLSPLANFSTDLPRKLEFHSPRSKDVAS